MTIALDLAGSGQLALPARPRPAVTAPAVPADAIPAQPHPSVSVSLTDGCEAPLNALKLHAREHAVHCHPCDEAVVRLLIARVHHDVAPARLVVSSSISPGTLILD